MSKKRGPPGQDISLFFKKTKVGESSACGPFRVRTSETELPILGRASEVEGTGNVKVPDENELEEVISGPSPELKEVVAPKSSEGAGAKWLRSLSLEDAKAVFEVMCAVTSQAAKHQVSEEDRGILASLQAVPGESRDGSWYVKWSTCTVATVKSGVSHPRWQVKLPGKSSVGAKLKSSLTSGAWETLLRDCGNKLRVGYHHVSYNADPRRGAVPLPLGLGAGASLSHLCDEQGCFDEQHLEASTVHKDNMDRQRCSGVLLLHFDGIIVKEVPCLHGKEKESSGSLEAKIRASCIKVRLLEISQGDFDIMAARELRVV
ncbi:hypothetical protein BOTNAR_0780g00010 [Botryotinia narcissicola]|uniref:Uncharacterized protein n=1 Tax=Botryotinia narcissicola TaxID=278944 RepID=A0A4Z1HD61_9HELO|nr:hypothetical protein BOTNAR_0780g00010 [Botryotinia narcissicola]